MFMVTSRLSKNTNKNVEMEIINTGFRTGETDRLI